MLLDDLQGQSLPHVAAALRTASDDIVDRWRTRVRELLPAADELTMRQLKDSVPQILEKIAAALEAADPAPTEELISVAPGHGSERFDQKFNFNELLIEYHILRRIILEQLNEKLGRALSLNESLAVHCALDVAQRHAAVAFAEQQAVELRAGAEAMAKYLSFLSHDLRGGLNGAMLMIEVLRRDLEREPRFASSIDDLDMMRRSMLDTVATMDRFLHAERLRRGKVPVRLAPVNIRQVFEEIARGFELHLKQRGLQLEVSAASGCVEVCDRDLLVMILQNLMSNAVKYSMQGTIRLVAEPVNGRACARLCVEDQGPGIAPERLATLFAPFTRGETHGQPGSGLGLSIARQAAELLGARLWAESTVGAGSKFCLELH
jgi:signal transduction histidine kinase